MATVYLAQDLPLPDPAQADSFFFCVMHFGEGEALRDRLVRETQLPIADAVRIATGVAHLKAAVDGANR